MSSLIAEPRRAGGPPARLAALGSRLAPHAQALATLAFAGLLIAIAFLARGGAALARTTTATIAVTLLGAAAVAAAIVARPPGRRVRGGVVLLLFTALAVLTAASIAWSIQPSASWQAANLTVAYLGAFAGALALANVAPGGWRALLGGVVLASVVVSGYALLAKVFPSISPLDLYARLRAPFDYWNAVGLMAALGIPGCLWLGARREGHALARALAVPALGLLLVALMLSYGRGPLVAAVVATACWFAVVPLRLRAAAVLAAAGAGAAIVCLWAFANEALSTDGTPLDVRADAGHSLGLLLVALLLVLLLAGLALAFALSRDGLSASGRRQLGTVLLTALALVPLAGVAALAASERGLTARSRTGGTSSPTPTPSSRRTTRAASPPSASSQ